MKRKFTFLMAALALLTFLIPLRGWGQKANYQGTFEKCTGELTSGTYVIGVVESTTIHAINNTVGTSWIKYTDVTISSNIITNPNESVVWIYDTETGYIKSNDNTNYIYWTSGNVGCCGETPYAHDVTESATSGVYTVKSRNTNSRILRRNGTNGYRYYTSSTGSQDICFYKLAAPSSDPSMSVDPNTIEFGDKEINDTYTETFTVTYANLNEDLTVSVGSGLSGITVSPDIISKDGSGSEVVTVSYNPTSVGEISGNITVSNTDDNLSQTVTVTGSAYDPASVVYYEKVTEGPSDWSGVYIVTYAAESSYEALTGVSSGNIGTHAEVQVASNKIVSNSTVDAYAVTIVKTTDNKYSMQLNGQYLYAQASNNLYASNSFDENSCEWTIEYNTTTNLVEITNVDQDDRLLQYNTGNPRFACYTGSQKDLTLFKYQGTVTLPLSAPVVTLEAGNGILTPTWAAITGAQSYTLEWSTSSTFASDVHEVPTATSGSAITSLTNGTTYYVRVKAIGDGTNYSNSNWSAVVSAEPTAYVVATPEFSVEGISTGTDNEFVEVASVTITDPDYNTHLIYYTTDGSDPDEDSEPYEGAPIDVITTTTIKAIAYDGDLNESEIGSITVTIVEPTPIADVCAAEVGDTYYITEGIVTYKRNSNNMFIEDDNAGILVYGTNTSYAVGDRIVVKGTRAAYQNKPELSNISILGTFSSNNTLPKTDVTVTQAASDDYLYRRVQLTQVLVGETESSLTPLTQGNNSISVYSMPSIENVTDEGYYLKTVTGIVAYYGSDYQMYVASDDIVPYTIDASSNNTTLGTVAANGYMVTATPATGIGYATPAYTTVVDNGVTCTVTQTDNDFKVVTNGDAMIEIQFASAPTYTISYTTNGIAEAATTEVLQSSGEITELIEPTAANIPNGYAFMGWTTSAISGSQNNAPDFVKVGDLIDDNTSLIAVFAIENESTTSKTVTLTANSSWSGYQDKTFTDDADNTWTANCTGNNVSGTYYYGIKADVSSYVHSPNFSGTITSIKIWGKNSSSTADRTFYIKSTQDETSGDLGTVSVPASTDGEELTATLTGSFTSFYLGASGALQFNKLQVTFNGASYSYSNYCTSVTPIEDDDLPINGNNELTENHTISGVNYLDTYIIVPDGITLTVEGTFGNSDPDLLVVEDGGQLIHTDAVQATLKKSINAYTEGQKDGWYTIASPVAAANIGIATTGTYDLYRYDEENVLWLNQELAANSDLFTGFNQGIGYLYGNAAGVELQFAGAMVGTNSTINVPLTCSATNVNLQGFNLVGNPFTRNLVTGDVNIIDAALTSYYYVAGGNELTSALINERPIKPGEGFFVQTSAAGNLVLNPSSKGGRGMDKPSYVRIEAGNESYMDQAYIQIGQGNTLNKMTINDNVAHVSVQNDNAEYAVATIEAARGEMPVNFKAAENGTYTIDVEAENLEVNYLHLIDNLTGMDVDLLATPSYTFEARKSDIASRFRLVFDANTGNDETNDNFVFINNGELIVNGNGTVQVIDILGRQMFSHEVNSAFRIQNSEFAPGVYVLRLVNGNDVKTQKIVIK